MNDLLQIAVSAHGGLKRWSQPLFSRLLHNRDTYIGLLCREVTIAMVGIPAVARPASLK